MCSPFDVGNRAQLFIDRALLHSTERVWSAQHPTNPLLRADRPWEGWRLALYGSVMYDAHKGIFKMWYWAQCGGALYATSVDGIHWEKPLVATADWQQGRERNIVLLWLHCPSAIGDRDDPDPAGAINWCTTAGATTSLSRPTHCIGPR